jgi:AraC-like DNA-binding protein
MFDGPQPIIFNEKGLQIWNMMYQNLEMGYSKENLTNTNLWLYSFIATFLYPDRQVNEKKQDAKNLINDAILYMQSELHQQLSVEDMALKQNLSASHFSNLFRKATGMAPLDYFIHLKLQKACMLLFSSDITIKKVAAEIGYNDPYYFSRLFKKYMKVSPEQYRALQKKS